MARTDKSNIDISEQEDIERVSRMLLNASLVEYSLATKCVLLEEFLESGDDQLLETLKKFKF